MSPTQSDGGSSQTNPWFAVSIGLVGLIAGYGIHAVLAGGGLMPAGNTNNPSAGQVASVPAAPEVVPPAPSNPATIDDDAVLGDENAKVTVIEFTDYQCPFCQRHYTDTYGQIKSQYIDTGKIKYVLRDFPLSFHPHAQKAAEATECADDQGKFWEMHDLLFGNGPVWSALSDAVPTFKQYAADLKLNTSDFNDCMDSGKQAAEVQKDMADGQAAGVSGTPGFWVIGEDGKGEMISGAVPFATFQAAIDKRL